MLRDGPAAAAENLNIVCAFLAQKIDNSRKKLDVPAVVTRDANGAHVLLDRGANDITDRSDDIRDRSPQSRAG